MVNSKVNGSDTTSLVAVSNTGSRVADVAKCAVVVSDDGACKCSAREIRLNGGI